MRRVLAVQDAGKVLNLRETSVVVVPGGVFPTGTVFILFNNSNEFMTIECTTLNAYLSARNKLRTMVEFPPKGLANVLFIDEQTVVLSGDVS